MADKSCIFCKMIFSSIRDMIRSTSGRSISRIFGAVEGTFKATVICSHKYIKRGETMLGFSFPFFSESKENRPYLPNKFFFANETTMQSAWWSFFCTYKNIRVCSG